MRLTTTIKHLSDKHDQKTHKGKKRGLDGKTFSATTLGAVMEKVDDFIRNNAIIPEGRNHNDGIGYDKTNDQLIYDFGKSGLYSFTSIDKPLDYKFTMHWADPKNLIRQ